jgi:hypothetical protein
MTDLSQVLLYWQSELEKRPDLPHYTNHCRERIKEIELLLQNKEE